MIDGDSDCLREFRGQSSCLGERSLIGAPFESRTILISYFDFFESEAASRSRFRVIAECWATDCWTNWARYGAWSDSFRFFLASEATTLLAARLVESGFHVALPVFVEVVVLDYVVASRRHLRR